MKFARLKKALPAPMNLLLTVFSAVLLVLAFPDFEFWFLAWIGLIPLFMAVDREKQSLTKSFLIGWLWGTVFYFGTCWWLTFAPIEYAAFPPILAYSLLFIVTAIVGISAGIFGGLLSLLLKRFGRYAIFAAPFIWTAGEYLRFWTTGNNWNAIAYSQAFAQPEIYLQPVRTGGIYLLGTLILFWNSFIYLLLAKSEKNKAVFSLIGLFCVIPLVVGWVSKNTGKQPEIPVIESAEIASAKVVAIQPNVPMNGFGIEKYNYLLRRHVELAEDGLERLKQKSSLNETPTLVIFPESPMNFMYENDEDFQLFIRDFARKHDALVLFNASEPDYETRGYFNSAVLVDTDGKKIGQYDKIHLVPFGETVPSVVKGIIPSLVSNFSYGKEYDLFNFGDAKAGIMICFESHFPTLSREFVRNGADVLIEMTNDGYLGNTGVLRQHLASAVFRAVETNRPVLRVTNVGVMGYINPNGEISEIAENYKEATRVWKITKSEGSLTFYMKYGDWAAWLGIIVTLALLFLSFRKRYNEA